jgi:hypothetical protein
MATTERIGKYEILRHLASGGMGRVFLARASGLGGFERHVVLKTLDIPDDDQYVAMFLDEARLVGSLHHQHIAAVYEVGRDEDGRYFLVMEYVHGQTAAATWEQTIERGAALPLDFALTVVAGAAAGLHYAHRKRDADGQPMNIVHRDVTLSNLMLGYDGAVKLIDFGIAKAANRSVTTQAGFIKGKAGYMSPEQILGHAVDHRSDIFALGIVLYELTTMTRAFREESDLSTMERIKRGQITPPSRLNKDYPRGLELIVMKALRFDPADRFQDADTLRRELEGLGHRQKLVLGDAAITEVMAQLFERRAEPWLAAGVATTEGLPSLPKHAPPLRELALGRRAGTDGLLAIPVEDAAANRMPTVPSAQLGDEPPSGRHLRAATEAAEQLVIEAELEPPDATRGGVTARGMGVPDESPTIVAAVVPPPPAAPGSALAAPPAKALAAAPRPPLFVAPPAAPPSRPPPAASVAPPAPEPVTPPTGIPVEGSGSFQVVGKAKPRTRTLRPTPATPRFPVAPMAAPVVEPPPPPPPPPPPRRSPWPWVAFGIAVIAIGGVFAFAMKVASEHDEPLGHLPTARPGAGDARPAPSLDGRAAVVAAGSDASGSVAVTDPARVDGGTVDVAVDGPGIDAAIDLRAVDAHLDAAAVDAAVDARGVDARAVDAAVDAGRPAPTTAPDAGAPTGPTRHLHITTIPGDVTVLLDGQRLGHTPYEGDVPALPGVHVLKLRKRGYIPQKLEVPLDQDLTRTFTLLSATPAEDGAAPADPAPESP